MGITSIEWTDRSINPFRARDGQGHTGHHCEKISPGCANCYASTMQRRFLMSEYNKVRRAGIELFLDESKLQEVLRRKTPTKWFWCDMTDMFLEDYPDEWIDKCFAVMALTPQHTHQILTKRPERMRHYLGTNETSRQFRMQKIWMEMLDFREDADHMIHLPFPNVWLGVSVEDQQTADERIPVLLETPAVVRWISAEPLLGTVNLYKVDVRGEFWLYYNTLSGVKHDGQSTDPIQPVGKLDWVFVGGESGVKARDCSVDWMKEIVRQCGIYKTPVFVKQLGKKPYQPPYKADTTGYYLPISDRKGKNFAEFPVELQVREYPELRIIN